MGILFAAGRGLFQLCPQVGGHLGGYFPGLTLHLFLVHHRGDGLVLQCVVLGLELVTPELGRLGHLPGACQLVLRVLGAGFGPVALSFGFLALAVKIFGNWRPLNIAGASLLYGLFKSIAAAYSSIDINGDGVYWLAEIGISSHLYRMLPYIITLLVLAFTSKKSRAPKAEGIPYDKARR